MTKKKGFSPTKTMEITIKDLTDLPNAAKKLLPLIEGQGVVALYGEMGAGKTTLISALLQEMGSQDEVTSPTFALVNDYLVPGGAHNGDDRPIHHFDFYRIESLSEAYDLGYEEYFYSGNLCLVEWPEKIAPLLPPNTLRLEILPLPDGSRRISITN